ncbi:hypothetical protein [Pedobacter duraquae]|uniref:Uncharacterized protein n=1 Tax=Pedobacter duraquae TaxID=425511 RepID=A0A4R6IHH1_9SPHI|nr:hypothetical protein [Pedobacter duraquae]TDO21327.1 hypothetical protein CLV32_2432 [Pedobacter duraquae]
MEVALLIDQIGEGNGVFEHFAIEFEHFELNKGSNHNVTHLKKKVELIERHLQDLSEKITAELEFEDNIYALVISQTKKILSIWLPIYSDQNFHQNTYDLFSDELDRLSAYVKLENVESKSYENIEYDFDHNFLVDTRLINDLRHKVQSVTIIKQKIEQHQYLFSLMSSAISEIVIKKKDNNLVLAKVSGHEKNRLENEETVYECDIKVWIDTNHAGEANRFMNIISGVLSNIENVDINITDAGVGSFWQNWSVKFNGWFAKEETKQLWKKTQKAAEAYSLDRHIEPVEKSKLDRKMQQEAISRLIPVDLSKKLHELKVQQEEEKLKALKISNALSSMDLISKSSTILASGLATIDSDFRIELNGLLLIKQEAGKVEFGNFDSIDDHLNKAQPNNDGDQGELPE